MKTSLKLVKSQHSKKDASRRLEMEQAILAIEEPSYTFKDARRIVVPHEADKDHCLTCHRIFHKAWDSLVRQGLLEPVQG